MDLNFFGKICAKCNEPRAASCFSPNKNVKDGLASWCKTCYAAYKSTYVPKPKLKAAEGHKYCARCKLSHRSSQFKLNEKLKSGLSSWCISCQIEYRAALYTPVKRVPKLAQPKTPKQYPASAASPYIKPCGSHRPKKEPKPEFNGFKTCTKCKETKEAQEHFNKAACGKWGYNSHCKVCTSKAKRLIEGQDGRVTRWLEPKPEPLDKLCNKCKQIKLIVNFPVTGKLKNGNNRYLSYCRPCENETSRDRMARHLANKKAKRLEEKAKTAPLPGFKICSRCKLTKKANSSNFPFAPKKNAKQHFNSYCRSCVNEISRNNTAKRATLNPRKSLIPNHKICTICRNQKTDSEFRIARKNGKTGRYAQCKPCEAEQKRRAREANPEKYREISRRTQEKHKDKRRARNKEKHTKRYREDPVYREKCIKKTTLRRKQRMKENPLYRLMCGIRSRVSAIIGRREFNKSEKFREYIGCTAQTLAGHLQAQFAEGMTWDNYGEWHLDHIVPISLATNESDVFLLSHYLNMQPLWEKDNREKRSAVPQVLTSELIAHLGDRLKYLIDINSKKGVAID